MPLDLRLLVEGLQLGITMIREFDYTEDEQQPSEPTSNMTREALRARSAELNKKVEIAIGIDPQKLLNNTKELEKAKVFVETAMFALDEEINAIKQQIEKARADFYGRGEFSDSNWWRRVNGAARAKGRQRQALQLRFGDLNRLLRISRAKNTDRSRERIFIYMAKKYLPEETYNMLWAKVDQEQSAEEKME